jgi:hypothetical protein
VNLPEPVFSASNASLTVTATAYLNGQIQRIDLSPSVVQLTEAELGAEIATVAARASEHARAAQYELLSALFRMQGQDSGTIREVLELRLQLPVPG